MITTRFEGLDRINRDLKKVQTSVLPQTTRDALNTIAFRGRGLWQEQMQDKFILRNTWTTRRTLVEKAQLGAGRMKSVLTNPNDYLETQEHGGVTAHSVPTSVATGEGRGVIPLRRLVRKPNALAAIHLTSRSKTGDRRQRNAVAVHEAAAHGQRFVFLELQRRKGLFRLSGGRRALKVDMLWNTGQKHNRIGPRPTLGPAVQRLSAQVPAILEAALVRQLKYSKVFGY